MSTHQRSKPQRAHQGPTPDQAPESADDLSLHDEEALSPEGALWAQQGLGNAGVAALLAEQLGGEDEPGQGALGGFAWLELLGSGEPEDGGAAPAGRVGPMLEARRSAEPAADAEGAGPTESVVESEREALRSTGPAEGLVDAAPQGGLVEPELEALRTDEPKEDLEGAALPERLATAEPQPQSSGRSHERRGDETPPQEQRRSTPPLREASPQPSSPTREAQPSAGLLDGLSSTPASQLLPAFNAAAAAQPEALQARRAAAQEALPEQAAQTGTPSAERATPDLSPPPSGPTLTLPATSLSEDPGSLSAEADPSRMQAVQAQAGEALDAASAHALAQSGQDFGEQDIHPAPLAAPRTPSLSPVAPNPAPIAEGLSLPPEWMSELDAHASPLLDTRLRAPLEQAQQGELDYAAGSEAAHVQAQQALTEAEAGALRDQAEAREGALTEVGAAREDWSAQAEQLRTEAAAEARRDETQQRQAVTTEQRRAEGEARAHLERAEQEAATLSEQAEAEAQAAEQDSGLLGAARSAASAVLDTLKATVHAIYDGLRAAVQRVFELAQALATGVIELAAQAITALMQAFAQVLQAILARALAAFPELAQRMSARIQAIVDAATQAVNQAAALLKAGVEAILGTLADTLDALLALSQRLYDAAFSLLGMLVSGEWTALLRGLEGLGLAAGQAPPQFEAAAYGELLGADMSEPLTPMELEMAGLGAAGGGGQPGPPWSDQNVGVDQVAHGLALSPELEQQLMARTGGEGELEFGWSQDPARSMEAILGPEASGGGQAGLIPDDGLSVRERAAARWGLMKQGLSQWWSANWPLVLSGAVLGVTGFIAANLLTGGAVLAALPAVMSAIGPLFMGIMAAQVGGYVADYLSRGWAGDARGGGKALASALAVGAIELLSAVTFKAGGAALKGAKALAKGAARGASKLARRGADYVIRKGKVLLGGLGDLGLGKRARSLDELGEGLANKTRFKGYRLRVKQRRFELEGKINPWILLADGKVEWKEADELKRLDGAAGGFKLGEDVLTKGADAMEGVVVGTQRGQKGELIDSLENLYGATQRQPGSAATLGVGGDDLLPTYKHLTQAGLDATELGERAAKLGVSSDEMARMLREQGDGVLTRMGQRADDEMLYALKAGQHEVADGGHSLLRHGPDVEDAALKRRLTEGVAPDLAPTPRAPAGSTQFKSYEEWLQTRTKALEAIEAGKSSDNVPVDLSAPPPGVLPNDERKIDTLLEYTTGDRSAGRGYVGKPLTPNGQKRVPLTRPDQTSARVWPDAVAVEDGVNRVQTTLVWDDPAQRWKVVQHFPQAGETTFDPLTKAYKPGTPTPNDSL